VLLSEVGEEGQVRLRHAGFRRNRRGDPRVYAVAAQYLRRAGCPELEHQGAVVGETPRTAVEAMAGDPALAEAAAAILGALEAVEHIKRSLGLGRRSTLPPPGSVLLASNGGDGD